MQFFDRNRKAFFQAVFKKNLKGDLLFYLQLQATLSSDIDIPGLGPGNTYGTDPNVSDTV